jgi:hypothetical protein
VEVVAFGRQLQEKFSSVFASNPRLKFRVARLLGAQLPPLPRRRGRPGFEPVTSAIQLRDELRRAHPEKSLREIWRQIYRAVIPLYDALPLIERRAEEDRLHRQVRWRLAARRRRRRKAYAGKTGN